MGDARLNLKFDYREIFEADERRREWVHTRGTGVAIGNYHVSIHAPAAKLERKRKQKINTQFFFFSAKKLSAEINLIQ